MEQVVSAQNAWFLGEEFHLDVHCRLRTTRYHRRQRAIDGPPSRWVNCREEGEDCLYPSTGCGGDPGQYPSGGLRRLPRELESESLEGDTQLIEDALVGCGY